MPQLFAFLNSPWIVLILASFCTTTLGVLVVLLVVRGSRRGPPG